MNMRYLLVVNVLLAYLPDDAAGQCQCGPDVVLVRPSTWEHPFPG